MSAPTPAPLAMEMTGVDVPSVETPDAITLSNVTWKVSSGEFWVVGGLQASGKTDLLMLAAGITRPAAGHYRVLNRELDVGNEHERQASRLKVGFVFDGGRLLSQLSVAENIALPLRYHEMGSEQEIESRVDAMLAGTETSPMSGMMATRIGRNWAQRVGLARALVLNPEILLVDNPLAGLDPLHAAWWEEFLARLAQGHPCMDGKPLTLVVTTHHFQPWANRARNFAILQNGQFGIPPETGDPAELDSLLLRAR